MSEIISGTAMSVLVGFGSIITAFFVPVDLGSRVIIFMLGLVFFLLGIFSSKA